MADNTDVVNNVERKFIHRYEAIVEHTVTYSVPENLTTDEEILEYVRNNGLFPIEEEATREDYVEELAEPECPVSYDSSSSMKSVA